MKQAILGLGRFGTFWSTVIAGAGPVYGWNRTPKAMPQRVPALEISNLGSCDSIWLCNAISAMEDVATLIAPQLSPGSLVLDTCSVKVYPSKVMVDILPSHVDILATHPMFGPDSASNGLAGLAMVLCPVRVSDARLAWWKAYFQNLGLGVLIMSPDEHDQIAARTQGVTHFIGRLLAELGLQDSPMATLGYQKIKDVMEQTCNDPWQLFLDLQTYNPHGAKVRQELKEAYDRLVTKAGFLDS